MNLLDDATTAHESSLHIPQKNILQQKLTLNQRPHLPWYKEGFRMAGRRGCKERQK